MPLTPATTNDIIKNFINDKLPKIAKFLHRQNVDVNDENHGNIVIRSGWTYKQGYISRWLTPRAYYGITFDEDPLVLIARGAARPVSEGAPTKLEDMDWIDDEFDWYKLRIYNNYTDIVLTKLAGDWWLDTYYYGVMWVAIGKKT